MGLTIYIFTEPGGKTHNIKRNPKVCAAIYEQPVDHSKTQKSLLIWGEAELITIQSDRETYLEKAKKWNIRMLVKKLMFSIIQELSPDEQEKEVEKMIESLYLIRIEPSRIGLRKYNPDFSMPEYEWKEN
jgi:nitroimidazol reductase NimA-like FMN-containing flavoprotein (pyridoxamine 5'-phosphate oxidase superfamily)